MQHPDFRSREFLLGHIRSIIDFYYPACINRTDGGYYNEYRDDGRITDRTTQHVVSTTRFIFNFCVAAGLLDRPDLLEAAAHGVRHLAEVHRDKAHGGTIWILDGAKPRDATKYTYGHAFVLLAYAMATKAGLPGADALLRETWDLLEHRLWSPEGRLYVDEVSADWSVVSPYRGQNANMHMTEAMLAAWEATAERRYLDRAALLAKRICVDLADQTHGLVWEHYHTDWSPDWEYNKSDPRHLFKPYGYLPGHLTEWTKLLLVLERHAPQDWLLPRARRFYEAAVGRAADLEHGGLHYSFDASNTLLDLDKYYWVHNETVAAAASLAVRTGETRFWQDYDRLWAYSWRTLVDRERGGWYRITAPDGSRADDLKSPPSKTDYHPLGACWEILRVLDVASKKTSTP